MDFDEPGPRIILARHHLNSHEKGAIIALSAVVGIFAVIIAALVYVWRAERANKRSKEGDLEDETRDVEKGQSHC